MPAYRFTFHIGDALTIQDTRDLQALRADLSKVGFVEVQRTAIGYLTLPRSISLPEWAVAGIELAD
jgi:hypothetical protein